MHALQLTIVNNLLLNLVCDADVDKVTAPASAAREVNRITIEKVNSAKHHEYIPISGRHDSFAECGCSAAHNSCDSILQRYPIHRCTTAAVTISFLAGLPVYRDVVQDTGAIWAGVPHQIYRHIFQICLTVCWRHLQSQLGLRPYLEADKLHLAAGITQS